MLSTTVAGSYERERVVGPLAHARGYVLTTPKQALIAFGAASGGSTSGHRTHRERTAAGELMKAMGDCAPPAMPTHLDSLKGQVALVTGAGSGIGQAAAIRLAAAGVKVAALDHTRRAIEETADLIARAGGEVLPLGADIARVAPLGRALARIKRRWGRLDIVFANAGINGVWARLEKLRPGEWDRTLSVNLRGTFLTVKFALPLMRRRGGSIILTSSVQGTRIFSNSGASAYATSKAGQVAFGRMCALELAARHIRVNTICPGAIRTHIGARTTVRDPAQQLHLPVKFPRGTVPLTTGRPGSADQVADVVLFLASASASHITGTEIYIDGAESLLLG